MSKNNLTTLCLKSFKNILLPQIKKPSKLHKGQFGKIGIVGGCLAYPGAAYFAAIGGYNMGVDLVHVFCEREAAKILQTQSPDLLVTDFFSTETNSIRNLERVESLVKTLDCVVLGCGAGTSTVVTEIMTLIINYTRKNCIPLVCDADVFRLPEILNSLTNHPQCILTPNAYELTLLEAQKPLKKNHFDYKNVYFGIWDTNKSPKQECFLEQNTDYDEIIQRGYNVISSFNIPLMVIKGCNDVILTQKSVILTEKNGSVRRCGGQGDLLAGSIGGMMGFLRKQFINSDKELSSEQLFIPNLTEDGQLNETLGLFSTAQLSAALSATSVKIAAETAEKLHSRFFRTTDLLAIHRDVVQRSLEGKEDKSSSLCNSS